MSSPKLKWIRLALVVLSLTALFGTFLPGFLSPVAGARASLLSAPPARTIQSEGQSLEELEQQMEAIKQQLESSGPSEELMEQYQTLLDQINNIGDGNLSQQSFAEPRKSAETRKGITASAHTPVHMLSGPSSLCLSGSLAAGDPTYNRARTITTGTGVQAPCSPLPSANNVRYDAYEFEITDCTTFPTNVTMTLCGPAGCAPPTPAPDTVLYVYRTGGLSGAGGAAHPFNPGDPCNNLVAANDDLIGVSVGVGGSSGGVPACSTSGALSGLQRSLGSGRFVVVVTGFSNATAGNYNLFIDAPAGGCTVTQVAGCPVVAVAPASIATGSINTAYPSTTFTASGGLAPYTFSLAGTLPTGMTFSVDTLSGTPTEAGGFPISVTATDANGCSGSRSYSLVITNRTLPCITDGLFAGGPTFNRPNAITTGSGVPAPCTLSPTGTSVFYQAYELNVSGCATGTLTATLCGPASCPPIINSTGLPDSIIYLYRVGGLTGPGGTPGAFNPLSPCTNLVAANDDRTGPAVAVGGSSGGLTTCSARTSLSGLRRTIGSGSFVIVVASFTNGQTGAFNLSVDMPGCIVSNCLITCPANISTSNDANLCGAVVSYSAPTTNGGCGTVTCLPASGSFFPVGTTTVTCSTSAGLNCSFTVTVNDTQAPSISCPANVVQSTDPNSCSAVVIYPNATATDNCPGVGTPVCTPASGSTFPKGTSTVSCTVSDASGNSNSCSFTVTVNDTQPPSISCPANITTIADQGVCTALVTFTVGAGDNCPGVTVASVPPSGSAFPVGTTTVVSTATDASGNQTSCSFTVTVTNPNPVVTITGPPSGSVYPVNTPINFTGTFTDAGGGTHTATWTFTSVNPTINQPGVVNEGTGDVSLSYAFTSAGVYFVKLTVNDSCGGSGFSTTVDGLDAMVVIFDGESFVTGGGWINSPAGAYAANPSLTGRANFGFNAKYHNGASIPTGQTEFKFKEADFSFHSTSYAWLAISGPRAQYKGSGTVNGGGSYGFLVTVIDGDEPGGGGVDKFRIKIWNKNAGNAVVYDTQPGDPESADPTTALGAGSIVIH